MSSRGTSTGGPARRKARGKARDSEVSNALVEELSATGTIRGAPPHLMSLIDNMQVLDPTRPLCDALNRLWPGCLPGTAQENRSVFATCRQLLRYERSEDLPPGGLPPGARLLLTCGERPALSDMSDGELLGIDLPDSFPDVYHARFCCARRNMEIGESLSDCQGHLRRYRELLASTGEAGADGELPTYPSTGQSDEPYAFFPSGSDDDVSSSLSSGGSRAAARRSALCAPASSSSSSDSEAEEPTVPFIGGSRSSSQRVTTDTVPSCSSGTQRRRPAGVSPSPSRLPARKCHSPFAMPRQKKRKKRAAPSSAPDIATPPPQKHGRVTRLPPPIHTAPSGESSIAAILCSLDSPTKAGAARRLGVPVSALASCSAADIHAAIAAGDGRDDVTSATFTFDDIVAWSHADRVVVARLARVPATDSFVPKSERDRLVTTLRGTPRSSLQSDVTSLFRAVCCVPPRAGVPRGTFRLPFDLLRPGYVIVLPSCDADDSRLDAYQIVDATPSSAAESHTYSMRLISNPGTLPLPVEATVCLSLPVDASFHAFCIVDRAHGYIWPNVDQPVCFPSPHMSLPQNQSMLRDFLQFPHPAPPSLGSGRPPTTGLPLPDSSGFRFGTAEPSGFDGRSPRHLRPAW